MIPILYDKTETSFIISNEEIKDNFNWGRLGSESYDTSGSWCTTLVGENVDMSGKLFYQTYDYISDYDYTLVPFTDEEYINKNTFIYGEKTNELPIR